MRIKVGIAKYHYWRHEPQRSVVLICISFYPRDQLFEQNEPCKKCTH